MMFWELLFCFGFIAEFSLGNALENELEFDSSSSDSLIAKIRQENLKYLSSYNAQFLNNTEKPRNILQSPLASQVLSSMLELKLSHTALKAKNMQVDKANEKARILFQMLELMGNTRDAKFHSSTLILARSKKSDGFLKSYSKVAWKWYNSDIIAASSNPETQLEIVNEWFSEKTGGRQRPFGALFNSLTDSLEFNVVSFESCWNKFKMVSAQKSKFQTKNGDIEVETIESKEFIGYANFPDLKVEAIRLPYKNGKFVASVILPYKSENLKVFYSLTAQDYENVISQISSKFSYVNYKIPALNLPDITLNENGVSTTNHSLASCEFSFDTNKDELIDIIYERFNVDRAYAMIVYHEETKLILFSLIVKNPAYDAI